MNLPIQLKFYKKLELYLELKNLNLKNSDNNIWDTEKILLAWAANQYVSLNKTLSHDELRKHIFKHGTEEFAVNQVKYDSHLTVPLENLTIRGYGTSNNPTEHIQFTREGLLMGEVINDVSKGGISKFKYSFSYFLIWLAICLSFGLLILNFIEKFLSIFCSQ